MVVFLAVALVVGAVVAARVESLDHVERQREMLLRSVSHDFRTPLAIISAATSDLMQSPDYDGSRPDSTCREWCSTRPSDSIVWSPIC